MHLKPKLIDKKEEIPTFFIPPHDKLLKNNVQCVLFGLIKKTRTVHFRWIKIKTLTGTSFSPIFEDNNGYEIPNKRLAEHYLGCKIELPKIIEITTHIRYEGSCSKCGRFHMEDNGHLVRIVGQQDQINEPIEIDEDDEDQNISSYKCSDLDCNGWYIKKSVVK
jgi:hypothetical protein